MYRSYASLWLSGVKRNERKEKPFLSAEVGSYHFEVWGAAACCTFLSHALRKFPILYLGGQFWVVPPTHSLSSSKSKVSC